MRRLHSILALAVLALVIVAAAIGSASVTSSTATSIDVHFDGYACGQTHTFTDDTGQTVTGSTTACPPVVTQTIANGATLSGSAHWEAFVNPDLPYSDGDPDSGVDFYVDGVLKHHEEAGNPWCYLGNSVCTLDTTTLANGAHALTAKAIDVNGSVLASVTANVTVSNVRLGTALPARMPESSGASHIFVNPNGSNSTCVVGNPGLPCQTIQRAFQLASNGTFIEASGTFTHQQNVTSACTFSSTNPVTLRTDPAASSRAVFGSTDTSVNNNLYFGSGSGSTGPYCSGVRIRHVTIASPTGNNGIKIDCTSHFELDDLIVGPNGDGHSIGAQGVLAGAGCGVGSGPWNTDLQIWNSTIFDWYDDLSNPGHNHAMYLASVTGFVIANDVIYDDNYSRAAGYAIQVGANANDGIITNNTCDNVHSSGPASLGSCVVVWGSGASGYTGGQTSNDLLTNNLFTNDQDISVTSSGSTGGRPLSHVVKNDSFGNQHGYTASLDYQPLYGTNQLFTCNGSSPPCPGDNYADFNPLYVNGAGRDYHLQSGSPARGKGDPAYTPPFDKDGNARSAPALGAYG